MNFEEASKIERIYIEKLNASLNKVIPTRTDKEYYEENREKITEYKKEWSKFLKLIVIKIKKDVIIGIMIINNIS